MASVVSFDAFFTGEDVGGIGGAGSGGGSEFVLVGFGRLFGNFSEHFWLRCCSALLLLRFLLTFLFFF